MKFETTNFKPGDEQLNFWGSGFNSKNKVDKKWLTLT